MYESNGYYGGNQGYPPPNPGPTYPIYRNPHDEERQALRKSSTGLGWTLFAVLAAFLILPLLPGQIMSMFGMGNSPAWSEFNGMPPILYYLGNGSVYLLSVLLPVICYISIKKIPIADAVPIYKTNFLTALMLVLFGVGLCLMANIPAQWVSILFENMGFSSFASESPLTGNIVVQVLFFFSVAVIPPLVEEFLFRGAILHALRRHGDAFAILGSAFLFAVFHGNFVQAVFAFPCGLVLALIVVKTNNIWLAVLVHALNNGISCLVQIVNYNAGTETIFYGVVFLTSLILGASALVFLLVRRREVFSFPRPASLLSAGEKFGAMVLNVSVILFMVGNFYLATMNLMMY